MDKLTKPAKTSDRFENVSEEVFERMTRLFKAFADPTRLRILHVLLEGERSVGEIARAVEMSSSAVSHQLAYLRLMRLVRNRREGRTIVYALDDDHVASLFEQGLAHATHGEQRYGRNDGGTVSVK